MPNPRTGSSLPQPEYVTGWLACWTCLYAVDPSTKNDRGVSRVFKDACWEYLALLVFWLRQPSRLIVKHVQYQSSVVRRLAV
jgi:hypothetical protein